VFRLRTITDPDECRDLWERCLPREVISDLWEVRACFDQHYRHQPHFIVAEQGGRIRGLLPLSRNTETGVFNFFPGETWSGKTWLEQNRIIVENPRLLRDMLAAVPGPYHLRYLRSDDRSAIACEQVDEIGYFFHPPRYDYDMGRYWEEFSHKTAKKLRRELAAWGERGVVWRFDDPEDFELMIEMNLSRYGESSYFFDSRFLASFRRLRDLLQHRGWLRMVTILVEDEPAAVDMGSVYNGTLTMLAGGTNAKFPGVAKLINTHHMTWASEQKLDRVDFLCGDFNWKAMFHLTPVPLYLLERQPQPVRPELEPVLPRRALVSSGIQLGRAANA